MLEINGKFYIPVKWLKHDSCVGCAFEEEFEEEDDEGDDNPMHRHCVNNAHETKTQCEPKGRSHRTSDGPYWGKVFIEDTPETIAAHAARMLEGVCHEEE